MSLQTMTPDPVPPALRRRGKRVFRTLQEIRAADEGPPLTIAELSAASGVSVSKLHVDRHAGYLTVSWRGFAARSPLLVDLLEAQRYLRALNLL